MGFMKEFKEFALRGNVMDLAIGVIIGAAFGKIVTALVESVIMPVIGMIIGDTTQFADWTVGGIKIGILLQAILDFIIIAFILFLILKGMNRMIKKSESPPPPPAPPTKTEVLLEEIRDTLKSK